MSDALDALERRIDELRAEVRRAVRVRDAALARALRAELRRAERDWDATVSEEALDTPATVPGDVLDASGPAPDAASAAFRAALGGPATVPAHALGTASIGSGQVPGALLPGETAGALRSGVASPSAGASGSSESASGSSESASGSGGLLSSSSRRAGGQAYGGRRRSGGAERAEGGSRAGLVPVREQVHQALAMLGAPAAGRMIVAVHEAFFAGGLRAGRMTSLRRDEERSFRAAPYARPYYLCAALTERLSPARGLYAVSTWPLDRRIVTPLSPRVDFLTAARRVAERIQLLTGRGEEPSAAAVRLLARMARNIPGAMPGDVLPPDPADVIRAAAAELEVHLPADAAGRASAARRAARQLADVECLFGAATLSDAARKGA
ncbi:hypothetical protein HNP84_004058 [Thermocatellispora tengchongensis]|uniref:Uncharacterized protein n=1 Tax=Thermocatellispora tengchongensis TaxID=1073253 RepID=A0A840P6W7_9ACTN|nr:hypothetical protein [Thermocatellispora tengchongensis]MBB5134326.1 hypothetical protein [Thermocatellispora tengchongensis]